MNPLEFAETEEFFLATLITWPEEIPGIASVLAPDDFALHKHGVVYAGLLAMVGKGDAIDGDTLIHRLAQDRTLEAAGGGEYVRYLWGLQAPSGTLAATRAKAIQEAAVRRTLRMDALAILEAVQDPGRPVEEAAGLAQRAALRASERRAGEGPQRLDTLLKPAFELLEKQAKGDLIGLPTGFADIDAFSGGFQKTDYVVLGGRPGMGKTVLATNIAGHVAFDRRETVLFCEMEMGKLQIVNRILFSRARINGRLLRTGKLVRTEFTKLGNAVGDIHGAPFFLDGQTGVTPLQLLSKARQIKMEHGLALIVVDNIQIMRGDGKYGGNKRLEISDVSNNLKRIAKELDCTVLAISHLSRECERRGDPEPTLSDLKETGDIEQDADVVMLLYREEVYKEVSEDKRGETKVIFAKFREGETIAKLLRFIPEHNLFTNYTAREETPQPTYRSGRDRQISPEDYR